MSEELSLRRPECPDCLRAQRDCICRWRRVLTPVPAVLILQHPLEIHQAKGSGRLLHRSLQGSVLAHGEQFDEAVLRALLYGTADDKTVRPVLLYPRAPGDPPAIAGAGAPDGLRLVILDATWRKSRKMLYLNPLLQQLPRLSLIDPPASRYSIRKAHRPGQLSTLESACHALTEIEGAHGKYLPLLEAFDGFVAQQRSYIAQDAPLSNPPV